MIESYTEVVNDKLENVFSEKNVALDIIYEHIDVVIKNGVIYCRQETYIIYCR